MVSTVIQFVQQTWTSAVRAALIQSDLPSVPSPFQEVIGSGHVLERMRVGTSPFGPTLAVPPCVFLMGPAWPVSLCRGVPLTGFFSPPYSRRERAPSSRLRLKQPMARRFVAWLPMPFPIKRAMHIHRCIKVSIRHVMTDGTEKQFSPLLCDAFAASVGKPFPLAPHREQYWDVPCGLTSTVTVLPAA